MADISKIKPNGSSGTEYDIKDATARSALENKANNTQTFTEASTRANIASGETMSTLFGKIKKFFTDLKTVAFTGSYNDLSNKPTIPAEQVQSDWNVTDTSSKAFIKNKPTIPTNTDEKVKQENTTGSADYRVLLSNGANDTTETKTARKSTNLKFNPSTGNLQATQLNGVTIGSSPKFTDNNTTYTLSADENNNQIKLTPSSGSAQSITVPYATVSGMCVGQATSAVNDTDGNPIKATYSKTDTKVTQTATTTNSDSYELLFSGTNDNTTRTEEARKTSSVQINPNKGRVIVDELQIRALGSNSYKATLLWANMSNKDFQLPNDTAASGVVPTIATREYLNSKLVQTVTLSGCASGSFFKVYTLFDKLVYCEFAITKSASLGANTLSTSIGTINASYRPKAEIYNAIRNVSGGKYYPGGLFIGTDGTIIPVNEANVSTVFYAVGNIMWALHD